ncbi:MAG: hypothetical protein IJY22_06855 [Clostridia bacterium]|nr:hypothetical protein [Clostridia bacterium]
MMKRVLALVLCLASVLLCLVSCADRDLNDEGAYIRMYLTEPVYDFDPLKAHTNEAAMQLMSLIYEPLFYADEDGEPQSNLVDDYDYEEDEEENEYILTLELNSTTWSDGVALTASHVEYAFNRLIAPNTSHPAVALLYDIKNARAIVSGDCSPDDLGVSVKDNSTVEILFEGPVEIDEFLLALCSPALVPMRKDIIATYPDTWSQKSTNMVCSGPFRLRFNKYGDTEENREESKDGFVLERNEYYFRDRENDPIDESVLPFRIIVDYTTDPVEQLRAFNSGSIGGVYYFGHIPLAARKDGAFSGILSEAVVTDAASTHTYYLNQEAVIGGIELFAIREVRQALSLAINREAIVGELVYGRPANGMVPYTQFNRADDDELFREIGGSYISAGDNITEATRLLSEAGITPSDYAFSICVNAADEEHVKMASMIQSAWGSLGFDVTVTELGASERITTDSKGNSEKTGAYDSLYQDAVEDLVYTNAKGREQVVEVIAVDQVAVAPDAFSFLAPFAAQFSGNAIDLENDNVYTPHITGYNCKAYNDKIEAAYTAADEEARYVLLHEAEQILLYDMPVIPVIYNQNATLQGDMLDGVEYTFFGGFMMAEAELDNYWQIALDEGFAVAAGITASEAEEEAEKKDEETSD